MQLLHCDVSDALAEQLKHKAEEAQVSVSEYLAELIKKDVNSDWPEDFFELFGAWEGEQLSCGEQGSYEQRLQLEL